MSDQPTRASDITPARFDYGYIIVIASFLVIMVSVGLFSSFGVFFKPMLNDFGWTRAVISAPIATAGVINGLASIMMGSLADRFGPRKVVMLCGILSGAGYLLLSQVSTVWQLYLSLGLLVGSGVCVVVPLMSTISRWFVRNRTIMTGIIVSGGGVGGFIVPLVSNWLVSSYGWRQSFFILGLAFLVIILAAAQFLRRPPAPLPEAAPAGTRSAIATPATSTRGLTLGQSAGTRSFWLVMASFFCFGFALGSVQTHIVPHATDISISAAQAAGILSAINGVSIIGNIVLGGIGDRLGNQRLFMITFILQAIACFWLISIQELWMFYLFAVIFGLAYGSGIPQGAPLVARVFGIKSHGLILGILSIGQMFGVASGSFLAGYIFDFTQNYSFIFLTGGILGIIGFLAVFLIKPVKDTIPSP